MIYLSPSILNADFSDLTRQIRQLELGKADWIHCDVMDGNFVPNLTFGPLLIQALNKITRLPLDVHLMIMNPDQFIEKFVEAGANILTIHQEAVIHLHRSLSKIKGLGIKAGVSINPGTSIASIEEVLDFVDLILVMSVNPGFGGQQFINSVLKKISRLKELKEKYNYNYLIEVDGGIEINNINEVLNSGAEVIVVGSSIFRNNNIIETTTLFKNKILDFISVNRK